MPTFTPTLSKATLRRDLTDRYLGGFSSYTTSGAGSTTTAVVAALAGIGPDYLVDRWLLCTSGANAGEFRRIVSFSGSTLTVANAFSNSVASGVTVEVHYYRPNMYTAAFNAAMSKQPLLYKLVQVPLLAKAAVYDYALPRDMTGVWRITADAYASRVVVDTFDRAASTSEVGNGWTAGSGDTWGINASEQAYSVTDADGDIVVRSTAVNDNLRTANVLLTWRFKGTLNSGADYRTIAGVFAYADSSNYLVVRLLNGTVDLRKVDGGSESSLATGSLTTSDNVWYEVKVRMVGHQVYVWVDDTQYISHTLAAANSRFADHENVGWRLDKGGAPATAAVLDFITVHRGVPTHELRDWEHTPDNKRLRFGVASHPYGFEDYQPVWVEGYAPLSPLDFDSTTGALTNDATVKVEIETTDPAYTRLLLAAKAELLRMHAHEIGPDGMLTASSETMRQLAREADAEAQMAPTMPWPQVSIRGAEF